MAGGGGGGAESAGASAGMANASGFSCALPAFMATNKNPNAKALAILMAAPFIFPTTRHYLSDVGFDLPTICPTGQADRSDLPAKF